MSYCTWLQTAATLVDDGKYVQCETCGRCYEVAYWDSSKIARADYGYTCYHTGEEQGYTQ